jgi:hypothetical protein
MHLEIALVAAVVFDAFAEHTDYQHEAEGHSSKRQATSQ